MSLFRRRTKARLLLASDTSPRESMRAYGHVPLPNSTTPEDVASHLSESFFKAPVKERNSYANSALTWAEAQGQDVFERFRLVFMQMELAIQAKKWTARFGEDVELAGLKLEAMLHEMARATVGLASNESYEAAFGPDIPKIVDSIYNSLAEAKDRQG